MSDKLSDVIPTASLLLAIVTALMGFWYAELSVAIHESEPRLPAEKILLRKKVAAVLWSKAVPLLLGSVLVAAIFFPRFVGIVIEAFRLGADGTYSDMKAALVATEVLMTVLAIASAWLAWQLCRKHKRLRETSNDQDSQSKSGAASPSG
jgi:hypothetical protein